MIRPVLDLDRYRHLADLFRYFVGGGRFVISVPTRRPRTWWWQFWRPSHRRYRSHTLVDAPLSERLMESWIKRLSRPRTTSLRPWDRAAPFLEFHSPAVREALLREVRECLDGTRRTHRPDATSTAHSTFLSGTVIDDGAVLVHNYLVNGIPRTVRPEVLGFHPFANLLAKSVQRDIYLVARKEEGTNGTPRVDT